MALVALTHIKHGSGDGPDAEIHWYAPGDELPSDHPLEEEHVDSLVAAGALMDTSHRDQPGIDRPLTDAEVAQLRTLLERAERYRVGERATIDSPGFRYQQETERRAREIGNGLEEEESGGGTSASAAE
jgi:hypothetical protein